MPINRIFAANNEGRKAHFLQMHFPSTELVELAYNAGMDGVDLDGEQGHFDLSEIDEICRVANAAGMTVTARVPSVDPVPIKQYLARGVQGIQGPGVESGEQAQTLSDSCYYTPAGKRSWGPGRGHYYDYLPTMNDKFGGNKGYIADANENMFVIAQLESQKSIDNLDDIVSVPGIHCITFGQNDMASSLGVPGEPGHDKVNAAHADLERRARVAGKHLLSDRVSYVRATVALLDTMRGHLADHRNDPIGQID
ncbi:MAG: aldolase/citrate lyase family protein [Chloroflexi bacterium]|nr:aldolase/citrate lyase family protein [Chloroflexota bacterium]MDA1282608.1 aldolase/citrate lyase family protein [Chloroflexota bacterium]